MKPVTRLITLISLSFLTMIGIALLINSCGRKPSPDFDPFLSPFIGVIKAHQNSAGGQQVWFITDTVFPIEADDAPDSQDIFDHITIRFAGVHASAVKLSVIRVEKGKTYGFLQGEDTPDDVSSNLITSWSVTLPTTPGLDMARYRFFVTACSSQGECDNTAAIVCVRGSKIVGKPRYFGPHPAHTIQASTCANPVWDSPSAEYGIKNTTSQPTYRIPPDWAEPAGPFNTPLVHY